MLMPDDYQRIELITGTARRRWWTTEQKLRIIEASFEPGETVSSVARRHGVAPNLLYRWRRLMAEGGAAAVGSDESVVGSSEVRRLEERVRELERLLGRKTMEVEILKEALAKANSKNRACSSRRRRRTLPGEDGGQDTRRGAVSSPRAPPSTDNGSRRLCQAG
jgi:transposase